MLVTDMLLESDALIPIYTYIYTQENVESREDADKSDDSDHKSDMDRMQIGSSKQVQKTNYLLVDATWYIPLVIFEPLIEEVKQMMIQMLLKLCLLAPSPCPWDKGGHLDLLWFPVTKM